MANVTWLADVLRRSGLKVWEDPGWKRRGHATMRPIVGVLCHHTAGGGSNDWRVVRDGRPGLRGPLAQMTLERDGTIRVLAAGVSWHAGSGYHANLPGGSNYNLLGIEGVSSGRWGDWTSAQMNVYPRMVAAILRYCELPVTRAVGHKEWAPSRKIDPSFDMNTLRHNVARYIRPPDVPASPGGIESMAFGDSFIDWAGNRQTVQSWMNLQDKRAYEGERRHEHIVKRIDQTAGAILQRWQMEDARYEELTARLDLLEAQHKADDADPKA